MNACPQCGGYNRIGDNYGDTCTDCGYNWGYGEWARQSHCNHVFSGGVCMYCERDQGDEDDE